MKFTTLVRNGLCALVLVGLTAAGAGAAQKRSNKGGQDAGNVGDERAAQVHKSNQSKQKKDKDRNPSASTNKTKGKHLAKGHSH